MGDPMNQKRSGNNAWRSDGFTIIELLLVIVIITILALIAIPIFLTQRGKGWDANCKSDLHNAAIAQATYYHDNATYSNDVDELIDIGYKQSSKIQMSVESADDTGYCLEAFHDANPERIWNVESGAGNPNPLLDACP